MLNSIKSIAYKRAKETIEVESLTQMVESADVGDAMLSVTGEPTTDDIYNGEYDDKIDPVEKKVLDELIDKIPEDDDDAADDEALIAKLVGLDKEDPALANVFGIVDDEMDE